MTEQEAAVIRAAVARMRREMRRWSFPDGYNDPVIEALVRVVRKPLDAKKPRKR